MNNVNYMEIEKIDRDAIIDELIKKGYVAKSISYEELQALHEKYGRGMNEGDFARLILDVQYSVYKGCRNGYNQVVVLKSYKTYVTLEEIEIIRYVLKERNFVRKKIFYLEFCELYNEYGNGMSEIEFAQRVLDITPKNFDSCKYSGTRVDILKSVKVSEEEIRNIIDLLVQEGYKGKKINYEELKELYENYGKGMRERDFAQNVLGVLYGNYLSCQSGKTRVKILKDEFLEKVKRIPEIIKILKENGKIGKSINYEELKKLYEEYGEGMGESEFALRVLEISSTYYKKCKNGESVIILKSYQAQLVQNGIELIIHKLKEQGFVGKSISYIELQSLHLQYGDDMDESDFAQKVLGIEPRNYFSCKSRCGKVTILAKYKRRISQDEVAGIIESIRESGYIGKSISYVELNSLYLQYGKEMNEEEFAIRVLGVTYANYMSGKNKNINVVVRDGIAVEKANEILNLYVNIPGFYSFQIIERICTVYDISLEDFVIYIYFGGFGNVDYVLDALKRNGGLCIGKSNLSEQFANEHIDWIQKAATRVTKDLCYKYGQAKKISDYTQDAIVYILENMGKEEQNFGDSIELFKKLMYYKIRCFVKGKIISSFRISRRTCSLHRKRNKDNEIFDLPYADKRANLEIWL